MKTSFFRAFLITIPALNFIPNMACVAQFGKIDTIAIQSTIDSCREVENPEAALSCFNNTLIYTTLSIQNERSVSEKLFLQKSEVIILRRIGNLYLDAFSDPSNALKNYFLSLKKSTEINYKNGTAGALFAIGNAYTEVPEYEKALDHYQKGLKIFEEIKESRGIGMCLNGIGNSYLSLNKVDNALSFYQKGLQLQEEREDTTEISTLISNIAAAYDAKNDLENAMKYYQKGLKLSQTIGDQLGIIKSLQGIGDVLLKTGKVSESEKYLDQAMRLSKELGELSDEGSARLSLRKVYEKQGKYKQALWMSDTAKAVIDSITKLTQQTEITKMEMQSDFDVKAAETKAEHEKQLALEEEAKKKQQVIIFSVIAGLVLVIVFSIFILNRWRITQKQKKIIGIQKEEVERSKKIIEEHNKDITDSIQYASRIQRALLTSEDYIGKSLKDYFILFKPKDIVSGDFYWAFSPAFESVGKQSFFFACCDCTGHGVPGAFMSLLNISFLNEAMVEKEMRDPAQILNEVRSRVVKALNPEGKTDTKDGMDAVLCAIDLENKVLHAACANNPLWMVKHGEVVELAPDKMPVGSHDNMATSFTKHTVQLETGDTIYLFTDGYADQFGGPKNKKFRYKQLEEVILANNAKSMKEQKEILGNTIETWRGENEQVDDILVIGIRI